MEESQNKKHLTRDGFLMTGVKYNKELERYLHSVPYIQIQGIKGMLRFFDLQSIEDIVKFIRENFSMKPTKNIVVNAIKRKLETEDFRRLNKAERNYNDINEMCRLNYFINIGTRVNKQFFQ